MTDIKIDSSFSLSGKVAVVSAVVIGLSKVLAAEQLSIQSRLLW